MLEDMLLDLPSVKKMICLKGESHGGVLSYEDILNSLSSDEISVESGDDEMSMLMYLSGTTERPKGVPIKNSGIVSYVIENVEPADPDIEEKNLLIVPCYNVAEILRNVSREKYGQS